MQKERALITREGETSVHIPRGEKCSERASESGEEREREIGMWSGQEPAQPLPAAPHTQNFRARRREEPAAAICAWTYLAPHLMLSLSRERIPLSIHARISAYISARIGLYMHLLYHQPIVYKYSYI